MDRCTVNVPPRVLAGLRRHAAAALPAECCGALIGAAAGRRIDVRTAIPLQNDAPQGRFHIDAGVVRRLERQATGAGVALVGFYHSHPQGPSTPSPADLELACPGYVHLIVGGQEGNVRAWRLRSARDAFSELPLALPGSRA